MHVPEFVGQACGHFLQPLPSLIDRRGIEVAPVRVACQSGEVLLAPLLAIVAAEQTQALRPIRRDGTEARRAHGIAR
ncbi:hypothetical protein D9M68_944810 [compost metagenome]